MHMNTNHCSHFTGNFWTTQPIVLAVRNTWQVTKYTIIRRVNGSSRFITNARAYFLLWWWFEASAKIVQMYQQTSGLCWKIIILQWNKLTNLYLTLKMTCYLIFMTYRTSLIEHPLYIHLLLLACYWIIHIFLRFCEVPVQSIQFLTMAAFFMVGLFECGVNFWAGTELISEVSFTAGVNLTNGDVENTWDATVSLVGYDTHVVAPF